MKILHIEDRFHPEMGYQINFFAKYHNPKDEFIILSSNSLSLWNKNIDEVLTSDKKFESDYNVKIVRLKAYLAKGKRYNIWIKDLFSTIRKINPDIIYIHAVESFTSLRLFLSPRMLKKYCIVTDTHTLYNQINNTIKFKLYYWFLKKSIFEKINKKQIPIFYTADENKEILEKVYKINDPNIYDCLIGTDMEVYRFDNKERENFRKLNQINSNSFVLLYTGKMNNLKQPHLILDALEFSDNNNLIVFFIGSRQTDYYNEKILPKLEKSNVYILNPVPNTELFKYYSMADVAVFPKENTLSSLDAQACKLPVIMEKNYTNENRLIFGGLVYEPGKIKDLAKKIDVLREDTELREKLRTEGYNYISKKYNYKNIVKNMEIVLDDQYSKFYESTS